MKHADKVRLKARKEWIKNHPERMNQITEVWVLSVDKFYDCDGDKLRLMLWLNGNLNLPEDLFPNAKKNIQGPHILLASCDDSCLEIWFEPGEEQLAKDLFQKVIDIQPITFKELRDLGFVNG